MRSYHLFVCYSHTDKDFVCRLSRDLSLLCAAVWLDEWELQVGDSLHQCIGEALEQAAYVAVVVSPDSVRSRWCQAELEQALTREKRTGKKVVLPLLHKRVMLPAFLEGRVYLDFDNSYFRSLAQLAAFLHGASGQEVALHLASVDLQELDQVKTFLANVLPTASPVRAIAACKFTRIMDALKAVGIEVDPKEIGILPKGTAGKTIILMDDCVVSGQTLSKEAQEIAAAEHERPPSWRKAELSAKDFANTHLGPLGCTVLRAVVLTSFEVLVEYEGNLTRKQIQDFSFAFRRLIGLDIILMTRAT